MTHPVHTLPDAALERLFDEALASANYAAALTVYMEVVIGMATNPDPNYDFDFARDALNGLKSIIEAAPEVVNDMANRKALLAASVINSEVGN